MSDRRRLNGPSGGTQPAQFLARSTLLSLPQRSRAPNELRKIFLQTGLIPSANGSAFLELEAPPSSAQSLIPLSSTIKLSCAVHGPKPLPRTANFSPNLQLTASVKFAPFANRFRRGYIRDSAEKDLGVHLENALKGAVIQDRWPKSAIDVAIIVLEGEDNAVHQQQNSIQTVGLMNVLAACITVASAALLDARIDCLDLMTGGVVASVSTPDGTAAQVLDPSPFEHDKIHSACVVGYLPSRDEVTEVWTAGTMIGGEGDEGASFENLLDHAISAARAVQSVFKEVTTESATRMLGATSVKRSAHTDMDDTETKQ